MHRRTTRVAQTAMVPIMTFHYDGVEVDLLFASLPLAAIPPNIDLSDDGVLRGVDQGTEKSLNGPRVTNLVMKLVPNYDHFVALVRCVRLWAKRRGLYSNKMGYLGGARPHPPTPSCSACARARAPGTRIQAASPQPPGVNCNILSAFLCQLYPNAAPSLLLERFFFILRDWKWPTPIMLTPQYDAGLGLDSWDPTVGGNRFHVMPILTPAYPSMNSSMSVSANTLFVMQGEMAIALDKVRAALEARGDGFAALFEPVDFCIAHSK